MGLSLIHKIYFVNYQMFCITIKKLLANNKLKFSYCWAKSSFTFHKMPSKKSLLKHLPLIIFQYFNCLSFVFSIATIFVTTLQSTQIKEKWWNCNSCFRQITWRNVFICTNVFSRWLWPYLLIRQVFRKKVRHFIRLHFCCFL